MKNTINIDDFLTVITWVKSLYIFDGKKFEFNNLYDQAITYKLKNTNLNTNIHKIDNFMIEAFKLYQQMKSTNDSFVKLVKKLDYIPFNINKDELINHNFKYQRICEDLLTNYKYENVEMKAIQKEYLTNIMNEYANSDQFEKAIEIRDLIKEI